MRAAAHPFRFSALQRAEIAEMPAQLRHRRDSLRFSALQRAEIAEIETVVQLLVKELEVSVLFNEPKLLKSVCVRNAASARPPRFSALQRAEIAEIRIHTIPHTAPLVKFQCSSTSRNC